MKFKYVALFCTAMLAAENASAGLFSRKKTQENAEQKVEQVAATVDTVVVKTDTVVAAKVEKKGVEPQEQPSYGEMNYDDELRTRCIRMVRMYMNSEEWTHEMKFEGFTELYLTGNDWGRESWNNGSEIYRYCTLVGVREENGVEMVYEWRFKQRQQSFGSYSDELEMGKNANRVYPLLKKN